MKTIYQGRIVTLKINETKSKTGDKIIYEHVLHKNAVAIVPVIEKSHILMIYQYRPVIGKWLWEIPAGLIDGNESPLMAAKRELEEEAGLIPKKLHKLMEVYSSPGFTNEMTHLFYANEFIQSKQKLEPDEKIKTKILSLKEIKKLIEKNKIKDAKTTLAIILTAKALKLDF